MPQLAIFHLPKVIYNHLLISFTRSFVIHPGMSQTHTSSTSTHPRTWCPKLWKLFLHALGKKNPSRWPGLKLQCSNRGGLLWVSLIHLDFQCTSRLRQADPPGALACHFEILLVDGLQRTSLVVHGRPSCCGLMKCSKGLEMFF